MVNDVNMFRTKNSFICFMLLCFISFVLNWLFIFPVSVFYQQEENSDNSSNKNEKIEFAFYSLCAVFIITSTFLQLFIVFMLVNFTKERHINHFESILDSASRKQSAESAQIDRFNTIVSTDRRYESTIRVSQAAAARVN